MASENDLIQDLYRRFDTIEGNNNTDSNSSKSSNHESSKKSEIEVHDISSDSS